LKTSGISRENCAFCAKGLPWKERIKLQIPFKDRFRHPGAKYDELVAATQGAPGDGGRVVTGGKALDGPGLFFTPTVVDGQEPTAKLAQEEVFGPIVTVLRAQTAEQAVEISNSVAFGLVTSVFTKDLDSALTVVDGLETGMIRVNMPTSGVDFHAPFGGEKQSSFGPREQGKAARELYTSTHTITVGPAG
jgi:aldehyde dehydrogenase (NAD+)